MLSKKTAGPDTGLAITMGDPAGVGPEIILKALARFDVQALCRVTVYGDVAYMRQAAERLSAQGFDVPQVLDADATAVQITSGTASAPVRVCQATDTDLRNVQPGQLSAQAGRAAAQCVIAATQAALRGDVDAIVTAPLNKEAMWQGGYEYAGHTELLADLTRTDRYGMLLLSGKLRVVHVSTHVSLREAIERVQTPRVLDCIRLANAACQQIGISEPHIGVAGLNPHAGEHGLFGTEDEAEILPAVQQAQTAGIHASGPHAPDTIFARAANGHFDAVVAMYHDQGHIPVKLHGFDSGVNVTVGLPILRTSVDHGTAFDIAGTGKASEQSLVEAMRVAVQLVRSRDTD